MPNIKEEALYQDLLTYFATILVANEYAPGKNYETDIGNFVKDWNTYSIGDDETEVLIIEDAETNYLDQDENSADHKVIHTYFVKLFLAKTTTTLADLRKASRDIRRCLGKNMNELTTKYIELEIKPVTFVKGYEKKERTRGGLVFRFTAEWSQEKWLIGEPEYA